MLPRHLSPEVAAALKSVRFIAQHIKDADKDNEVRLLFSECSSYLLAVFLDNICVCVFYVVSMKNKFYLTSPSLVPGDMYNSYSNFRDDDSLLNEQQ